MESFGARFKNSLVLLTLLVLQIVALGMQVHRPADRRSEVRVGSSSEQADEDTSEVTMLRSWVIGAVTPVERLLHGAGLMVRRTWWNYLDLRHVREENAVLVRQMGKMRLEQAQIAEDALQGQRLQQLLAFQEHYVSGTVAAQVIGTSGTDRSRVVYLDKGAADGLRPDMAVLTPDGIVGKVRTVFPERAPHTAQVLLLNDQTSGAGVVLESTRIRAVLRGSTEGALVIQNLTGQDQIKPGDRVTTSGGDGIFPRGLPVGVVAAIGPDQEHPPYWAVRVRPASDLQRLEEVLVLTGTSATLPSGTRDALIAGAATTATARAAAQRAAAERAAAEQAKAEEEAARSAAEIVAQRLPSLRDPNETEMQAQQATKDAAAAAASPRLAGGVVPKPLSAEHADRYTPGTVPSARAMVPGGGSPAGQETESRGDRSDAGEGKPIARPQP